MSRPDCTHARAVRVRVPATAANLGPGFDVLGLALTLYNEFTVRETGGRLHITVAGADGLPDDESNLFYRAFAALCRETGRPVPGLRIHMALRIPSGRGLGSSATAVAGGLQAANALLGIDLSPEELLPLAVRLEHGHHPDNVAPALLGGLVANTCTGDTIHSVRLPFPDDMLAVVFIPDFEMDTVRGRKLMPAHYAQADVVFNTSRVALFLAALTSRRYDLLGAAMEDRLHQPYRTQLFPALPALIAAARGAGAWGACLSGGGSTVLALTPRGPVAEQIGAAMAQAAEAAGGIGGEVCVLEIERQGATACLAGGDDL
jgi:homoserine kinase